MKSLKTTCRASRPIEKKARLARMSYAKYLTDVAACHEDVVKYLQRKAAIRCLAWGLMRFRRKTPGVWSFLALRD